MFLAGDCVSASAMAAVVASTGGRIVSINRRGGKDELAKAHKEGGTDGPEPPAAAPECNKDSKADPKRPLPVLELLLLLLLRLRVGTVVCGSKSCLRTCKTSFCAGCNSCLRCFHTNCVANKQASGDSGADDDEDTDNDGALSSLHDDFHKNACACSKTSSCDVCEGSEEEVVVLEVLLLVVG